MDKRALVPVLGLAAGAALILWRLRQLSRQLKDESTSAGASTIPTEAANYPAAVAPSPPKPLSPAAQPALAPPAERNARPPLPTIQPQSERDQKLARLEELKQQIKDAEQQGRKEPAAAPAAPPPKSTASIASAASAVPSALTISAAELAARVGPLIDALRPTLAGDEERKRIVSNLLDTLRQGAPGGTAGLNGKEQRVVARAFVDAAGPEVVYEMESSMNGNWIADAKNGTMQRLSEICKLPGPVGKAMTNYRALAEKNKIDAADEVSRQNGRHAPGVR